ncbi:putative zinc-binding alcohol dehydrogenase domain-containing protein cipB [Xylariomycetidae sp. FL2044]|nr:putative zinc-binding alcohol dehydrogenase domain-containing protein cipB [Xylariomycetidae sp. FL2044]
MPANLAAYLVGTGKPYEVRDAPYPTPGDKQVIIRAHTIALNPCDYGFQMFGQAFFPWLKYPAVVGEDVAGEVVAVGPGITRFKTGDRVTGHSACAFQKYPILDEHKACAIPDTLSFERASVFPLTFSTAVLGLFHRDYLALKLLRLDPTTTPTSTATGKTVLIWGGATSVGSNAIQLAVAAGYEVISTSSPRNFEHVKGLGASQVFDYKSPTVEQDLVAAFRGKTSAGALAIGGVVPAEYPSIMRACAAVVTSVEGSNFVAIAMRPPDELPANIRTKFIDGSLLAREEELGYALYGDYLPRALAAGSFRPAPNPEVVGNGLESVQAGLDTLKAGVSAKKLVINI